jgi:hypothetical protein
MNYDDLLKMGALWAGTLLGTVMLTFVNPNLTVADIEITLSIAACGAVFVGAILYVRSPTKVVIPP